MNPERFYVATSGGQIHGRRFGIGPDPVILLHRTPVDSSCFDAVSSFLNAQGHTAIALDTPGFGASFTPTQGPDAGQYGRWLLEAIDGLGIDRFHLCGHHTGTHFAVEIAQLVSERVLSLTLSGVMLADSDERARLRTGIAAAPAIDADGRHFDETFRLMKSLFLDPVPALVHQETMGALASGHGRDYAFDAIFAQDFEADLHQLTTHGAFPIQVVQASDDPLTLNGMLAKLQKTWPQLPVTLTGPAFLALPERQPGALARAILSLLSKDMAMDNRHYELVLGDAGYALHQAKSPIPVCGPGEVLVRVRSVSLNRRDLGVRDFSYPVNGANHFVPMSDAAGDVVAVGPGVTRVAPGDRVMSTFFQTYPGSRLSLPAVLSSLGAGGPGVLADHVILSQDGVLPIPDDWSYDEAACLPCAGVTAWSALKTLGQVQPGDHVLVIGTGGVALFAVQIAAASGAKVIVLSSSDEKINQAKAIGATHAINYREHPEWAGKVRELTGGAGVQHVIELGGDGTLQRSIASLSLGGHLALIGALDGFGGQFDAIPLIMAALRVSAVMVGSPAEQAALCAFMVEHDLKPVIDSRFAFDAVDKAYRRADTGAFGKVVIQL